MTDRPAASSESVRKRMENTAQSDTPAEIALRRELHRRGLRYRVDRAIPGVTRSRPDVVFASAKVAVFVDGCFWHSCPQHGTLPSTNREWWETKLTANVERDNRHNAELASNGWIVRRFWEHEDPTSAAATVEAIVRSRAKGLG